jgi:diguanylate cyclase (GGDEF)-like protein
VYSPTPDPDLNTRSPSGDDVARDTLRLVRLRLSLALIATAILPIAVGAPILRLATDDSRSAHISRQGEVAIGTAAAASALMADARDALAVLADDPAVGALARGAKKADRETVTAVLRSVRSESGGVVDAIVLLDGSRAERARVGTTVIPPTAIPRSGSLTRAGGTGSWQILFETPIGAAGDDPAGSIVAVVSLSSLLDTAVDRATSGRHTVRLVEVATGTTVAGLDGALDPSSIPDQVIGLATDPAGAATARAPLLMPGLGGLVVEVADPFPVTSLPVPVLAGLGGLIALIVMFIVWMARRILDPAVELDASRTRLKLAYDEAREAALRDSLTGLGNHRAFQEEFAAMIDQARRYGHPLSLILIDVDEFKLVNDSFGHAVGDDLLAEIGRLMRRVTRQADRAFRIGGDEFALVLTHTDAEGAVLLGRRLLAAGLETRPEGRYTKAISFSAGVSTFPDHGVSREDLQTQADAALYRGKRSGRTTVTLADPDVDQVVLDDHRRAVLSAAIARIVAARAVKPVYQPIVHLPTGRIIGFEGLIRPDPATGFADPGSLFAAAEVTGRSVELDLVCMEAVVAGAAAIPDPALASINVSPRTLEAPEFSASRLLALLDAARIDPSRVVLELTEHDAIDDIGRVRTVLEGCRAAGIRIAADDVGAGNAGLRLLSQFRFDVVKIDLSLVQAGAGNLPVREVLDSIVKLAETWGALVVAEGVETTDQLATVRGLGIEAGQGYLLGRPAERLDLERVDIEALLARDPGPLARLDLDRLPVMQGAGRPG